MFVQQVHRVGGAAEVGVAGVEQQEDLGRVGQRHQLVNIGRGLHVGTHMVVVGQLDAVGLEQVLAEGVQALGVGLPQRVARKLRALGHRRLDLALHRAGTLAVHHNLHAVVLQLAHVGLAALDFGCDGLGVVLARLQLGQKTGVPAGHAGKAVLVELGLECGAVFGEFVAQLEADVADLFAFAQRGFQRRFAAQGGHVVVEPGDGIDADLYVPGHGNKAFI